MPSNSPRVTRLLAAAGAAAAFAALAIGAAPTAGADPSDLVPLCSGDESPREDNCRTACPENAPVSFGDTCTEAGTADITGGPADNLNNGAPGADPGVPLGTDPDDVIYGQTAE